MHFRFELLKQGDDRRCLPAEDSAIPEEAAFANVLFSEAEVWFFAEVFDFVEPWRIVSELLAAFDVAVSGGRERGSDAEEDEALRVLADDIHGAVNAVVEGFEWLDDVIGGHDKHDAVGITVEDFECGEAYAGSGIAGGRFDEQVINGQFRQLLVCGSGLDFIGDDP